MGETVSQTKSWTIAGQTDGGLGGVRLRTVLYIHTSTYVQYSFALKIEVTHHGHIERKATINWTAFCLG